MWYDGLELNSWAEIKTALKERFDCCMVCHSPNGLDVHHIDPRGMGGRKSADTPDNAALLCRMCHNAVHDGHAKMWRDDKWVYYMPRGEGGRIIWELSPPCVQYGDPDAPSGYSITLPAKERLTHAPRTLDETLEALKPSGKTLRDALEGVTMYGVTSDTPASGYWVNKITTEQHVSLVASWFEKELYLKQLGQKWCETSIEMGHILHDFHSHADSWTSLGYESFEEFLGQPDIAMKRTTAYMLIGIWKAWAPALESQQVTVAQLAEVGDTTKLYEARKLLREGMAPQEALSMAREHSRSDLRADVDEAQGKPVGRYCYQEGCGDLFKGKPDVSTL